MNLPGLSCACGETDLIAVRPGDEPEYATINTLNGTPMPTRNGTPAVAWCAACWPTKAAAER